jgi:PKD repeat protein
MRLSIWTTGGALVALCALGACTKGSDAPAPTVTPAASPQVGDAQAPPPAVAEDEADEILMVWAEAEPDEGAPPLAVQLKADISGGVGNHKVKWEFGDDSPPSEEVNPSHTYPKPGTYRASVEVTDSSGDSDSDYVDIEVGAE